MIEDSNLIDTSSKKNVEDKEKEIIKLLNQENNEEITSYINNNLNFFLSYKFENDDITILQKAILLKKEISFKTIIKTLKNKLSKEELIKYINEENKKGFTSLHFTLIKLPLSEMKYLIEEGGDKNKKTKQGYNLLHLACQNKRIEHLIYLVEIEKFDYKILDNNNISCLHWCSYYDFIFGIQYFLSKKDDFINVNIKDNNNLIPLQMALINNSMNCIEDLILSNSNLYNLDNFNKNCFDYVSVLHRNNIDNKSFFIYYENLRFCKNLFKVFFTSFFYVFINLIVYYIFLPNLDKDYYPFKIIKYIILSLYVFSLFCFLILICINPGKKKNKVLDFQNGFKNFFENQQEVLIENHCPYCISEKENKFVHHCVLCNNCIPGYIKHSNFFGKCIGIKNFKFLIFTNIIFIIVLFVNMALSILIFFPSNDGFELEIKFIKNLIDHISNNNNIKKVIFSTFILISCGIFLANIFRIIIIDFQTKIYGKLIENVDMSKSKKKMIEKSFSTESKDTII